MSLNKMLMIAMIQSRFVNQMLMLGLIQSKLLNQVLLIVMIQSKFVKQVVMILVMQDMYVLMNVIIKSKISQTKDYNIGICCFSAQHATLSIKSTEWLARYQDQVSEWGDMSIHRLLFQ